MIIRRISEAIKKQDWFVVSVEVMIVVVGIFIGLQVDDWNNDRKDRADEQVFYGELHEDIIRAEQLVRRVRGRRLERVDQILEASDVIFGRSSKKTLEPVECGTVAVSKFINVNIPVLPTLAELMGTGRMAIIENNNLRRALVDLSQKREAASAMMVLQSRVLKELTETYPDLIQAVSFFDESINEPQSRYTCDLEKMRANQAFLNAFALNIDAYDAFIRDGLRPWSDQFDKVHEITDTILGLTHGETK